MIARVRRWWRTRRDVRQVKRTLWAEFARGGEQEYR